MMELDDGRESKGFDFRPVAERIAFALDYEAWTRERGEMRRSEVFGLPGGWNG